MLTWSISISLCFGISANCWYMETNISVHFFFSISLPSLPNCCDQIHIVLYSFMWQRKHIKILLPYQRYLLVHPDPAVIFLKLIHETSHKENNTFYFLHNCTSYTVLQAGRMVPDVNFTWKLAMIVSNLVYSELNTTLTYNIVPTLYSWGSWWS